MNSEIQKIKALGLGNSKDLPESKQKSITIKYVSSTIDEKNINLKFTVTQINLTKFNSKVFVLEMNATNEIAVNQVVTLKNIKEQSITVSFDRNKEFDNYIWQDSFVYQATINCDGVSAETNEFKMKFVKEKKVDTSICERDLKIEEVKEIVKILRENTFYSAKDPKTNKIAKFPLTNLPWYSVDKIFHRNSFDITKKFENEIVTNNSFDNFTAQLNKIFKKFEINNCKRRAHFLSQIFVETQFFTKTIEADNNYTSEYDPLRGRGFIHLTLPDNYKKYSNYKKNIDKIDIDFLVNYSLISTNLEYAADASGWYWKFGSVKGNTNLIADKGTVKEVTPYVNAASLNLEERENAFNLLIKIFK